MSTQINPLYTPRSMIEALKVFRDPSTAFLRLFFRSRTHKTRHIEVDFSEENRVVAPYIVRGANPTAISKQGYRKFSWTPPYISVKKTIEPNDLQTLQPGENAYSELDPQTRMIMIRNNMLRELENSIQRAEEIQAIQAIWNKSIIIRDENGTQIDQINFVRKSDLDETTSWANPTTATPLKTLRKKAALISKYVGLGNFIVIHGSKSAERFLDTDEVNDAVNKLGFATATVSDAMTADMGKRGLIYIGTFDGVQHWRYDEYYFDPYEDTTGKTLTMIPEEKSLIAAMGARNFVHYGAIDTMGGPVDLRRYPKVVDKTNEVPEIYEVVIQSAPLAVTHQPDAFAVLTTT